MTRQQNRSTRRRMRGGIRVLYPQGGSRRRRSMRGGYVQIRHVPPDQGGSRRRRSMRGGERTALGGSIRRRSMRGGLTGLRGGPAVD